MEVKIPGRKFCKTKCKHGLLTTNKEIRSSDKNMTHKSSSGSCLAKITATKMDSNSLSTWKTLGAQVKAKCNLKL